MLLCTAVVMFTLQDGTHAYSAAVTSDQQGDTSSVY
jgi:hypothetical protein